MQHIHAFINGAWVESRGKTDLAVTDCFTEAVTATYRSSSVADVDDAVNAARHALGGWAKTPLSDRIAYVRAVAAALSAKADALTETISREVGMPRKLAARIQVGAPIAAWGMYADLAERFAFERRLGHSLVIQAPVGVVAAITPWNYPLHQITGKVAPALLAGCTVVLKPSEIAPSSAFILARCIEEAGLPPGVFNLVHGSGPDVGERLVTHSAVNMVSFTGSTRAGKHIAALAAADIKRLALELGGKSAAIVLPAADLAAACKATLASCLLNSGQTCSAITRLIVPRDAMDSVRGHLTTGLAAYRMGDPADAATRLGPLVSYAQQRKVLAMISAAQAAGAECLRPQIETPPHGYFVPPTVLMDVAPDMAIARDEVFGPVLCVIPYDTVTDAVQIANGTEYGLAGAVWGPTVGEAVAVARQMRAGQIDINGAPFNPQAPFGGFGQSGFGRENGVFGLEEFLEPISIQLPPDPADHVNSGAKA